MRKGGGGGQSLDMMKETDISGLPTVCQAQE